MEKIDKSDLKYNLSKLITRILFIEAVNIKEKITIKLLDFIDWNCKSLFMHVDEIATDEMCCNFMQLFELANKYNKNLTGLKSDGVIVALLDAVLIDDNPNVLI